MAYVHSFFKHSFFAHCSATHARRALVLSWCHTGESFHGQSFFIAFSCFLCEVASKVERTKADAILEGLHITILEKHSMT